MLDWLWNALGCGAVESADAAVGRPGAPPPQLPRVMINRQFISPQEQRLFHTLQRYYGIGPSARGHVLAEVALNRLLYFPNAPGRQSWQNRVNTRSIDFLIVDPKSLRPMVAIELDDKSHLTEKREQRDATVNTLCAGAGLRLVRLPGSVTVEELKEILGRGPA